MHALDKRDGCWSVVDLLYDAYNEKIQGYN